MDRFLDISEETIVEKRGEVNGVGSRMHRFREATRRILHDVATRADFFRAPGRQTSETVTNRNEI